MEEIPLEELFTEEDWEKWIPREPIVRRNKNNKTISVKGYLNHNRLEIKVIAPYQVWADWEEAFMENSRLEVEYVLPYLTKRTPRGGAEAFKVYFEGDPFGASNEFYCLFLIPANSLNPAYHIARPRGGSPYQYSKQEMVKIRYVAQHLYVLMQYWLKKPRDEWPLELRKFADLPTDPTEATQELIQRAYGIASDQAPDVFQKNYLGWKPLTSIKNYYNKLNYQPKIPYIKISDLT
jgi:hypothetical protein